MSSPVCRTALREAEKRRVSPSSAHSATAVIGPTPYWACSARQPGWRRANAAICWRSGASSASRASRIRSAAATASRPAGDSSSAASRRRRLPAPSRSPAIAGAPW